MENAGEALKMAAAMMIFAGALTITIFMLSKAREASTSIMAQADRNKTYYNIDNPQSEREVGIDSVISNIYSYYQTQNTIVFYRGKIDNSTGKIQDDTVKKMPLYETKAEPNTLAKSSLTESNGSNRIYGLDLNDEAIRDEQWLSDEARRKQFVDFLINKTQMPSKHYSTSKQREVEWVYSLEGRNFMEATGARFIERIGEYNSDLETSETNETTDVGDKVGQFEGLSVDSSIIRFNETSETIDNSKGDKKKVIQYIFIEN